MPAISDRTHLEQTGQQWMWRTSCTDCHRPISLPYDAPGDPHHDPMFGMLEQVADMTVCDQCQQRDDDRRAARDQYRAAVQRQDASDLPAGFRDLLFSQMIRSGKRAKAIDAAAEWARSRDAHGLLLWGESGTGKSRLAATAAWDRLQRGECRWCSVAALIARLQASFADDDRREALRVLTGTEPLVLDDIDKVKLTETVSNHLFVALDKRINMGVPLLVTTNLPPGGLEAKFGDAIGSRLLGYFRRALFEMDGPDRRLSVVPVVEPESPF